MTPAVAVYLALAVESPDADTFAGYASEARRRGASHSDVERARRSWHLTRNYRRPVCVR